MKKHLAFVIPNLSMGGGEKSLVNLLSLIDYKMYSVDLILLDKSGPFLKSVPNKVKIKEVEGNDYLVFKQELFYSVISFVKQLKFNLAYHRFLFAAKNYFIKSNVEAEQKTWGNFKKSIPIQDTNYDVAIGFLEKTSNYFVVDKVQAKKKIGFIHNDYNKLKMSSKIDEPYFNKLDYIVTVSEGCKLSLIKTFPKLKSRFKVIFNISSQKIIWSLASKENNNLFKEGVNLLTLGRLNSQKGYDNGVKACKILVNKGIDVNWYVLGEGEERGKLEKLIQKNNLEERFILLGNKENPYPYILNSDIYVQPSKFEGKSIAIDEAKILQKPIVVTNFSTAKDQINHRVNGLIADMNPQSIADSIETLINDKVLKNSLIKNLSNEQVSTENEIYKFYKLIENQNEKFTIYNE